MHPRAMRSLIEVRLGGPSSSTGAMTLIDAQFEVFQRLVRRPLLVLDTEYTDAGRDTAPTSAINRLRQVPRR